MPAISDSSEPQLHPGSASGPGQDLEAASDRARRGAGGRPVVAVTIGRWPAERVSVHRGYVDAIWAIGAYPLVLTPPPPDAVDEALALVADCVALCVTGGGDIGTDTYGEASAGVHDDEVDADRDAFELASVRLAADAGMPTLGICRGHQLLAIAYGGGLYQDVVAAGFADHWFEAEQYEVVHDVRVESASTAAALLDGLDRINSIHHQAVADPGSLRASAWSPDGLIEAVEAPGVLGVQWHPERLLASGPDQLRAFHWMLSDDARP